MSISNLKYEITNTTKSEMFLSVDIKNGKSHIWPHTRDINATTHDNFRLHAGGVD